MEITTSQPSQQTLINPSKRKSAGLEETLQPISPIAANSRRDDKANNDTLDLSVQSLKMSQPAIRPASVSAGDKIEDARSAVAKLVADIRNFPGLAVNAHGNASKSNIQALLG